jgi:hypothetical protein
VIAALRRGLRSLAACFFLLGLTGAPSSGAEQVAAPVAVTALTDDFSRFYDETVQMPRAERVRSFRARFNALLPGFYEPRYGKSQAAYDAQVASALAGFDASRRGYGAMAARFPQALASGVAHVRLTFPDFRPDIPVYLIHSLGEMDGGTRVLRKRNVMIFGVDRIAQLHADASLGPFIDHELFHIHHARFYRDCARIRCSLWQEGLATYAAATMNGTRDPHLLMLDSPSPIPPQVDAHMGEALCLVQSKLDAVTLQDREMLFYGGERATTDRFPKRFGYYVGYLVAREAGRSMSLTALARLNRAQAEPVVDRALARLIEQSGGCPVRSTA